MRVEKSCLEVVRPFIEAVDDRRITNLQFFGGIGSAALGNPGIEISVDEKLVCVPKGALDDLMQRRPDGTLRDLDCLVLSTDRGRIAGIEQLAQESIPRGSLELSFFGFKPLAQLAEQRRKPLKSFVRVNLSDRYVEESGGRITTAKRALYPFAVDIPPEALDTWQLQIGGETSPIPIPHPGASILNYLTRSISGLRPKDATKVSRIANNVLETEPSIRSWIVDGPGASQLEFARILQTLRSRRSDPDILHVGSNLTLAPLSLNALKSHPACDELTRGSRAGLLKFLIEAGHIKSRGVHFAENQEKIVTLWQKHFEQHFQGIIKNR